ncbi:MULTISPECIES: dihydroxyacetone kinase subunit DhaL [unclassified Frigoribacterium]|jgi:dihydroxyacetone kinase-like protein|uniref:dihydroxyacetone kinase subunit DhaL n=1 Tax=unclassified Frigoribacterium TaxID=2627005 RepID=UPI0005BAA034|nr:MULTISPECIES: dihydroxyacetone kinase subunit DhaL [unclassified Frigoribacterium]KIU03137.1 dihydroxyacetone kinase [Frigoribacterium sp. MEB024]KQN45990.1 dihydroxyacetone kinase [Frigoribacterium sp. Leaf44]MBD8539478.1 dihydroxyacetone kinase subunit L [Frigoribacterium sp. CFBP 8751]
MTLDATWTRAWIDRTADVVAAEHTALSELDRQIGDGDHGENLSRGFTAVRAKLADLPTDATPGAALKLVATTLISTVGGASGPLLGTAYLKGAAALGDATELDAEALVAFLTAARDGVVLRGKAEVGDKTMIDAWTPAVDAAAAAAADGASPEAVLRAAADAAATGAASTEPLVARKGRASYLGERAVGHRDPGAQSSSLIIAAAADAADGSNKES